MYQKKKAVDDQPAHGFFIQLLSARGRAVTAAKKETIPIVFG
jgi:hypothetical protein